MSENCKRIIITSPFGSMTSTMNPGKEAWSGARCGLQGKGTKIPSRSLDGRYKPEVPSCVSPDQITYWRGIKAVGPLWPQGPGQFEHVSSVDVS